MQQGDNILSAAGFFNPMLGAGNAVQVGGGGGSDTLAPFYLDGSTIRNCWMMFGRRLVSCEDTELSNVGGGMPASGAIFARVHHPVDSDGLELSVEHGPMVPECSASETFRGLYVAKDGEWTDLRSVPTVIAMD